jgi:hypothetical protein
MIGWVASEIRIAALVGAVALAAVGCGSSARPGTPGAGGGGSAGSGLAGSGGAPTGGSGGQDGGVPATPSCLAQLAAPCLIGGACTYTADPNIGGKDDWCFGSGVRLSSDPVTSCNGPQETIETTNLTVRKPDGSICYTLEWTCNCANGCADTGAVTWKDPAGNVVATGHTTNQSTSISCASAGDQVTFNCPSSDPFQEGCSDWPPGIVVFGYFHFSEGCEPATCP